MQKYESPSFTVVVVHGEWNLSCLCLHHYLDCISSTHFEWNHQHQSTNISRNHTTVVLPSLSRDARPTRNHTTVQGKHSQHVSQRLTIEFPAKRLKSRKESGENTSICYFCLLGACFIIFTRRHPYRKGQKGRF